MPNATRFMESHDQRMLYRIDRLLVRSWCRSLPSPRARAALVILILLILLIFAITGLLVFSIFVTSESVQWHFAAAMVMAATGSAIARREIEHHRRSVHGAMWLKVLPEDARVGRQRGATRIAIARSRYAAFLTFILVVSIGSISLPNSAGLMALAGAACGALFGLLPVSRLQSLVQERQTPGRQKKSRVTWEVLVDWMGQRSSRSRQLIRDTAVIALVQVVVCTIAQNSSAPVLAALTGAALVAAFSLRHFDASVLATNAARVLPRSKLSLGFSLFAPCVPGHLVPVVVLLLFFPQSPGPWLAMLILLMTSWSVVCRLAFADRPMAARAQHLGAAALLIVLGPVGIALIVVHAIWLFRRLSQ